MAEFFRAQLDYIYLFYGLSFILLGSICYFSSKNNTVNAPFIWLTYFAFAHGINEWLDLLALNISFGEWFSSFRMFVLFISFVFLLEFARRSFNVIFKRSFHPLIYIPLFILVSPGIFFGFDGLNAGIRYFVGFPSAILAGIALFGAANVEKEILPKRYLIFSACIFVLYGVFCGLVVPKTPLFPTNIINYDSFLSVFFVPVQFVRGICAVLITFGIWQHFGEKNVSSIRSERFPRMILVIVLFFVLILGGLFVNSIELNAKINLISEKSSRLDDLGLNLSSDFDRVNHFVISISGSPLVVPVILNPSKKAIDTANNILDRYAANMGVSVCYLMNSSGIVVASSNRNDADSFVGMDYSFRDYFKKAIKGGQGTFYGLGVTSNKKGYYASYPVLSGAKIVGVAVIKKNIDANLFSRYGSIFFVSPNGIVFASDDPKYDLHQFWPLEEKDLQNVIQSRYFGPTIYPPILSNVVTDRQVIDYMNSHVIVLRRPVGFDGWMLYSFVSVAVVSEYRLFGIIIVLLISLAIIGGYFFIRQREQTLETEEYLAAIVSSTTEAVIGKTLDGTITSWNRGAEKMYGYSCAEAIGKNVSMLAPAEKQQEMLELLKIAAQGKTVENLQTTRIDKFGNKLYVSLIVAPIIDDSGAIIGASGIAQNITEKKKIEKELALRMNDLQNFQIASMNIMQDLRETKEELENANRKLNEVNQAKSEFVSTVAHELKAPLATMKEGIELILDKTVGEISDQQAGILTVAKNNIDRLARLIGNLLNVSKIEAGKVELNKQNTDFRDLVVQVAELFKPRAAAKGVELRIELPNTSENILIDPDRMTEVLINLVGNSLKFTEKGQIVISVFDKGSELECSVSDTGVGLSKEDLPMLFGKFKQFAHSNVVEDKGSGLGLAITKALIEMHRGKIWAESELGRGTKILFTLPK